MRMWSVLFSRLAAAGIHTNAVPPGYIVTDVNAALTTDPQFTDWVCQQAPAWRWGYLIDMVGAAVWLTSSASGFVSSQVVYVDGGMTAVLR